MKETFINFFQKNKTRVLTATFFALFLLVMVIPQRANAQVATFCANLTGTPLATCQAAYAKCGGDASFTANPEVFSGCVSSYDPANPSATKTPDAPGNKMGGWVLGGILTAINTLLAIIEGIIAGILYLAGILLDKIISFSITNLATNIKNLTGINTAWTLIRDLCNMSFIFVLVYNGIMTIFTGDNKAKKIIVPVIIAALLINFSLFFTKIIIDASNIVAISFYNSVLAGSSQAGGVAVGTNTVSSGISTAFMTSMNLSSLYSKDIISLDPAKGSATMLAIIGGSVFMLIAAFVFLAMTVLFFIRYIAFILLLIISPLGYMASVIPGLQGISKKFWDTLIGQALFAPIFMIMVWIDLTLMQTMSLNPGGAAGAPPVSLGAALTAPSAGGADVILNYFIVIGLLIATIIISKDYATKGGIVTSGMVNKGTALLGGVVFGGAAYAGRKTIGRFADSKANDENLKERAKTSKFAKLQLKAAQYGQKSTFDARQAPGVSGVTKFAGIDMGKGGLFNDKAGTGGYAQMMKDKEEKQKKFADSLAPSALAVAEAKEKLKNMGADEAFVVGEDAKKEAHLHELDKEIAKMKTQSNFTVVNAERKDVKVKHDQTLTDKLAAEKRLRDLQVALEAVPANGDPQQKEFLQRRIASEQKSVKDLDKSLQTAKELLAKKNEMLAKVDELTNTRVKDEKTWVSDDLRKTIELAGGSKVNKDSSVIKALGFDKKETENAVQSAKESRIEAYADNLEKTNSVRAFFGIKKATKVNRRLAVAARSSLKAKPIDQALRDYIKANPGEEAKPETPAPTATPTPTPTPNP